MSNTMLELSISEIKELVKTRYRRQLAEPNVKLRPIMIIGPAGVGKTEIIKQAAKELSEEFSLTVDTRFVPVQFCEPPEFMGLAQNDTSTDGELRTVFGRSGLLPDLGHGLYFLDEANRVNKEIRQGMLTLLQERKINEHALGNTWMPVLAGNPFDDDGYEVAEFDKALADRVAFVKVKASAGDTISYLKSKYAGHFIVTFLENNPGYVSFKGEQGKTPRSIEFALRETAGVTYGEDNASDIVKSLSLELGVDNAMHIYGWLRDNFQDLTLEDILEGKKDIKKWMLENKDNNVIISRAVDVLVGDIQRRFDGYSKDKDINNVEFATPTERTNVREFIEALPREQLLSFFAKFEDKDSYDYSIEYVFAWNFLLSDKFSNGGEVKAPRTYHILKPIAEDEVPEVKKYIKGDLVAVPEELYSIAPKKKTRKKKQA